MGGFLSGNRGSRATQPNLPETQLRIATALQGQPRPLLYGQGRMAPNVFLASDFMAILGPSGQPGVAGGKGGGGGGGKGGGGGVTWSWYYFCDALFGFGSVPIINLPTVWNGQSVAMVNNYSCFYNNPLDYTLSGVTINSFSSTGADLAGSGGGLGSGVGSTLPSPPGTTLFKGDYLQTDWTYLLSVRPEMSLAYRGEAYLAWQTLNLGTSSSIPSLNFEYISSISFDVEAIPDANPKDVFLDYLTNPDHGVPSFSATWVAGLTNYRDYCRAAGLFVSPQESQVRAASSFLGDLAKFTNSNYVWSSGKLSIVPYGDAPIVGNGTTWIPNVTPVYGFGPDDFITDQNSGGPVTVKRRPRAEMVNHLRFEYLKRDWFYNPEIVDIYDEAAIATYGIERVGDVQSAHMIKLPDAAHASAALLLQREQIAAAYVFTVGRRFIVLDPMDLVTVTEPSIGLQSCPVRIVEMQENSDGSITITAEEYPGTVTAPIWGTQGSGGTILNANSAPGPTNNPIIFEPPDAISNGLEIWLGLSGQNTTLWGGADVFVSYDGVSYAQVGTIRGPSRMGALTANTPAVARSVAGPTIDGANTLAVDLTESAGELSSGSPADLAAANLLMYVGGELIAYEHAVLTAANKYDLSPLSRGAYLSDIVAHSIGDPVLHLDDAVLRIPFTQDRVGADVSLKFRSFNVWGQGQGDLSSAPAYPYTITGAALASALPNVTNLRTMFSAGFMQMWWDEVQDFRTGIRYKITKGPTFASAIPVGDVAHPPFTLFGNDTYWVSAYCVPVTGLLVSSAAPPSITVTGNMLVANILQTTDEKAGNWPGTLTGLTASGGSGAQILSCVGAIGYYEIPSAHQITAGYLSQVAINAVWAATGAPAGQNMLASTDFLANPDIFGAAAAAFITSWVEISTAQGDPGADVFAAADAFSMSDMFSNVGSSAWSAWQKFVPGTYYGKYFKLRVAIQNANPSQVTGLVTGFSYTVSVAPRVDHYQNQSIAPSGTTIQFRPDGAGSPAAFNGGPNGAAVPYVNASWNNEPGDQLVISGLSTSGMTVLVLNQGVGVARSGMNLNVEGY